MPKVSIKAGVTVPGLQEYSSVRADVDFSDIDPAGDVAAQFELCLKVLESAEGYLDRGLAQQVANTSGLSIEGMGVATALKELKDKLSPWAKGVTADIKALKGAAGIDVVEEKPAKKSGRRKAS